jgi:hypothetical protein
LSEALKHFKVAISKQEEDAEWELLTSTSTVDPLIEKVTPDFPEVIRSLGVKGVADLTSTQDAKC